MKRIISSLAAIALLWVLPASASATQMYAGGSGHCVGFGYAYNYHPAGNPPVAVAQISFTGYTDKYADCNWIHVEMKYNYGCNGWPYVCTAIADSYTYGYQCPCSGPFYATVTRSNANCVAVRYTWDQGFQNGSDWIDCSHA